MNINTKNYEGVINRVFIDDRETERIEYAEEQYSPFNPIVDRLDIGDYIFESRVRNKRFEKFETAEPPVPSAEYVVFEYKTGQDFLNSIRNKRLENQVYDMVTNFDYTFVIVECKDLRAELQKLYYSTGINMSLNQVDGAIADFCTSSTVLFVQTEFQAFDMMMRIAGKIFQHKPIRYKYGKKTSNSALNYLYSIKNLGKKAENIVNTLELKTLNDLMNLTKEDLMQVELVGEKTAEMILKNIGGDSRGQTKKIQQNKVS